jgi:hypothetical protein
MPVNHPALDFFFLTRDDAGRDFLQFRQTGLGVDVLGCGKLLAFVGPTNLVSPQDGDCPVMNSTEQSETA